MEEQKNNPFYSDTAYDDAFRTMETLCDDLVIPFVNLMFGEKYDSTAVIKRLRNEHFIEHEDESVDKRITDSFFEIICHGITKRYHLECESKKYSDEILIRIFEYSTQIAKENHEGRTYKVKFSFPNSGLLLLKRTKDSADNAVIELEMPDGKTFSYNVPFVKMSDFTEDDIFDKKVYMLLPFLIFNYEDELRDINDSQELLEAFFEKYKTIYARLDDELEKGNLSQLSYHAIIRMIHRVAYNFSMKYENVQAKVGGIMGGKVIELPELKMIAEGEMRLLVTQVCKKLRNGKNASQISLDLFEVDNDNEIAFICEIAARFAPKYKEEDVLKEVLTKKNDLKKIVTSLDN